MNIIIAAAVPLFRNANWSARTRELHEHTSQRLCNIEEETSENQLLQGLNSLSTTGMRHMPECFYLLAAKFYWIKLVEFNLSSICMLSKTQWSSALHWSSGGSQYISWFIVLYFQAASTWMKTECAKRYLQERMHPCLPVDAVQNRKSLWNRPQPTKVSHHYPISEWKLLNTAKKMSQSEQA